MQDIINTRHRLQQLFDEYEKAFELFNDEIDGQPISEEQMNFANDANLVRSHLLAVRDKLDSMIEQNASTIWSSLPVVTKQESKAIDYTSFINQQNELMQAVEKVLKFPLKMDTRLIAALMELVYKVPAGSGIHEWHRKELRMFLIAISGWMLIKRYGGEFIIQNKLCVRLHKVPFIIELENRMKISGSSDTYQIGLMNGSADLLSILKCITRRALC